MIDKIIEAVNNFNLSSIIGIVVLFLFFSVLFSYMKHLKNNLLLNVYIISIFLIILLALLSVITDKIIFVIAVAIITFLLSIILSSDIKRDINRWNYRAMRRLVKITLSTEQAETTINAITRACTNMSKNNIGALIIIANEEISSAITESGTVIGACVSSELIETIFWTHSPLHDGAILIKGDSILAARCYLPLTQSTLVSKELGTRHRAAIGVTEYNPTLTAIVVSEETGIISVVVDGVIKMYLDATTLKQYLLSAYKLITIEETNSNED